MKNRVIYTCLVGDYDPLLQPKVISNDFDYICFSNDIKEKQIGVWKILPIPYEHSDNTRLSRFVKLNPHKALDSHYQYSLWIDANIQIIDESIYAKVEDCINNNALIAQVVHPFSKSVYDDIFNCICYAKEKVGILCKQYQFLKQNNYPKTDNYFYENNLIFRQHHNLQVISISEEWWNIYMLYSKRDQLSLCFVYWNKGFVPNLLLEENYNVRNFQGLQYFQHSQLSTKDKIFLRFKFARNRFYLFFLKRFYF